MFSCTSCFHRIDSSNKFCSNCGHANTLKKIQIVLCECVGDNPFSICKTCGCNPTSLTEQELKEHQQKIEKMYKEISKQEFNLRMTNAAIKRVAYNMGDPSTLCTCSGTSIGKCHDYWD